MMFQPTQNEDVTIRNWMYPEVNQHRCENPWGESMQTMLYNCCEFHIYVTLPQGIQSLLSLVINQTSCKLRFSI